MLLQLLLDAELELQLLHRNRNDDYDAVAKEDELALRLGDEDGVLPLLLLLLLEDKLHLFCVYSNPRSGCGMARNIDCCSGRDLVGCAQCNC